MFLIGRKVNKFILFVFDQLEWASADHFEIFKFNSRGAFGMILPNVLRENVHED